MNDMAGLAPLGAANSTLRGVPSALSISDVLSGKRVLLAGARVLSSWLDDACQVHEGVQVEHILTPGSLPDQLPFPAEECAFMLASIPRREISTEPAMRLPYLETKANLPCREVFRNAGWQLIGDDWTVEKTGDVPTHITLIKPDDPPASRAFAA